jgi:hypothetical protein
VCPHVSTYNMSCACTYIQHAHVHAHVHVHVHVHVLGDWLVYMWFLLGARQWGVGGGTAAPWG